MSVSGSAAKVEGSISIPVETPCPRYGHLIMTTLTSPPPDAHSHKACRIPPGVRSTMIDGGAEAFNIYRIGPQIP
jgi:hypothetical protein